MMMLISCCPAELLINKRAWTVRVIIVLLLLLLLLITDTSIIIIKLQF